MKKKFFAIVLGLTLVFGTSTALAGMTSSGVGFSVAIVSGCSIDTGGAGVELEAVLNTPDQFVSVGVISITCDNQETPYMWGMNGGNNWGMGSWGYQALADAGQANYISYRILNPWIGDGYLGDMGLSAIEAGYEETTTLECASDLGAPFTGDQTFELNANFAISEASVVEIYDDYVTFTVVFP